LYQIGDHKSLHHLQTSGAVSPPSSYNAPSSTCTLSTPLSTSLPSCPPPSSPRYSLYSRPLRILSTLCLPLPCAVYAFLRHHLPIRYHLTYSSRHRHLSSALLSTPSSGIYPSGIYPSGIIYPTAVTYPRRLLRAVVRACLPDVTAVH
jgi:hypothetical protein